jgi:hypothetical protein
VGLGLRILRRTSGMKLQVRESSGFVSGHDFIGCEKSRLCWAFVSGHDFQSCRKRMQKLRALAPARQVPPAKAGSRRKINGLSARLKVVP